jgi:hypothetical protein
VLKLCCLALHILSCEEGYCLTVFNFFHAQKTIIHINLIYFPTAILADEMGLGKTVQVNKHSMLRKNDHRQMVVS